METKTRIGRGGGRYGLLRADGSRCWPMTGHMQSPFNCGGGHRADPELCGECGAVLGKYRCPACGTPRER